MLYESALKSDKFLVVAHGTAGQAAQSKSILETSGAFQFDIHPGIHDYEPHGQS
jgi:hypothetical protein